MEERLQKILARAGVGSRRQCEEFIDQHRVSVNGKVAQLGDKANPVKDTIVFDGRRISQPEPLQYIILHKPRNVISTTTAPDPRPTVLDLVQVEGRIYPVGRLDIESEGLILLTNDGDLANRVTHPRYGCDKEYRALVPRKPDEQQLRAWRSGVVLPDGYKTAPARVRLESESSRGFWLRITMHEGRKRQIREIGETLGLPILRLIRLRIGSIHLGKLKPREWRHLTDAEVQGLFEATRPQKETPKPKRKPGRPMSVRKAGPPTRRSKSGPPRKKPRRPGSS